MPNVSLGNQKIEFERLPSRAKNVITLRIDPRKNVIVLASVDVNDGELTQIVKGKARWILDKFQRIDEIRGFETTREFTSGESFSYKGKLLRLKVRLVGPQDEETVFTDTTTIFCRTQNKDTKYIKALLEEWYKARAKAYFEGRVTRLARKLHGKPTKIGIRDQLKRWGSCTKKGEILLNWRIIMAPPSIIDYVVIHELAHLQEKNHTPKFWETVKNAMPNYKEKQEWLRINGAQISREKGAFFEINK
jgi:hypothetical protein